MITQTKQITIGGITRELQFYQVWGELHAPGDTPQNNSMWNSVEPDCVLVTIGRGKKLWKTGLHAWGTDLHHISQNTVNNRNSSRTTIQGWNADNIPSEFRSQHKGQI